MWSSRIEQVSTDQIIRIQIELDSLPVSYSEVLFRWQSDPELRDFFLRLLVESPFPAFRWETPPITALTANRPFEFVLVNSPGLDRTVDVEAFAEHFKAESESQVVEFANLAKDAVLVVPCPMASPSAYGHFGAFVRNAPVPQQHTLLARVGTAMQRRLGTKPVWLSTAGAGVSWLHVRLDDRPKYYGFAPYRDLPR